MEDIESALEYSKRELYETKSLTEDGIVTLFTDLNTDIDTLFNLSRQQNLIAENFLNYFIYQDERLL